MHIKIDLKIFLFAIIFIIAGNIKTYLLLIVFALIHELGHAVCALILKMKIQSIRIMPYGFELKLKVNYEDYNQKIKKSNMLSVKKILIYSAGPLINIIISIISLILMKIGNYANFTIFMGEEIFYSNILIGLFNLIPIYPMDGGKIIKEILHINKGLKLTYKYIQDISWISISVLTAVSSLIILYFKNVAILLVLIYMWRMVIKYEKEFCLKEKIYKNIQKSMEIRKKLDYS